MMVPKACMLYNENFSFSFSFVRRNYIPHILIPNFTRIPAPAVNALDEVLLVTYINILRLDEFANNPFAALLSYLE
jgi:hypothetical protein